MEMTAAVRPQPATVPAQIVLYAALALADLGFTVAALAVGHREGNPVMNFFVQHGCFEYAKMALTMAICSLGYFLWHRRDVKSVMTLADCLMICVTVYHVAFWAWMPVHRA